MSALFRRIGTVLLGGGVSKAALLGFELAVAAGLGAESYGAFTICLSLLLVLGNLSQLGLNFGLIQGLAEAREEGRDDRFRQAAVLSLGVVAATACAVGLVLALAAGPLARAAFNNPDLALPLLLTGLAIPFEAVNQSLGAIFRARKQFRWHVVAMDGLRNLILVGCLPVCLLLEWSATGMAAALLAGNAAATAVAGVRVAATLRHLPRARGGGRELIGGLLRFSAPLFGWNVLQRLVDRGQVLIAGLFLSTAEVGVLGVLLRMLMLFTFLQSSVNHVVPIEFAEREQRGDRAGAWRVYEAVTAALLVAATAIGLALAAAPTFAVGLLGAAYGAHAMLLIPLLLGQLVNVGTGPMGQLIIYTGHQRAILWVALVGGAVQIGTSLILIPRLGLAGAVAAEVATITAMTLLRQGFGWRLLGRHFFNRAFFVLASAAVGATALAWGIGGAADLAPPWLDYTLRAAVAEAAFAAVAAAWLWRHPEARRRLAALAMRLVRRRGRPVQ